jgi:hypothetical protein
MPVTLSTSSPEEAKNFMVANGRTVKALDHAILVLSGMPPFVPFEQRARVELEKAQLIAERAELEAEFDAFLSETRQIEPPDAPTVQRVEQAAADLNQMTANSVTLDALVRAATTLINAYRGNASATPLTGQPLMHALASPVVPVAAVASKRGAPKPRPAKRRK